MGLPGSLKPVAVIVASSSRTSAVFGGQDTSGFKDSSMAGSIGGSKVAGGLSRTVLDDWGIEISVAGVCCSGSLTFGSSTGLFFFALLLGFAFPLHE